MSVIVVNFDGRRFLDACLSAISETIYSRDSLETILVDNASSDGSVEFVRNAFPWVRIVQNPRNLGYAGGNNIAMRQTAGKYVVLLNNDTRVEPNWLRELVRVAESDGSLGACTSKLLFLHDRLTIELRLDASCPGASRGSSGTSEPGIVMSDAEVIGARNGRGVRYVSGVRGEEGTAGRVLRWTADRIELSVDVPSPTRPLRLRFGLGSVMAAGTPPVLVRALVNGLECAAFEVSPRSIGSVQEIVLLPSVLRAARPVIQNAGTDITVDGSGRDRGDRSVGYLQAQEEDLGQYDSPEEMFGFCGASALLRREALDQVGLFDDWFFAYYEDLDLAWRMRLRGWRVAYVPTSVVRHVHCGTSVESSTFFRFHVERNRIAMLLKNASARLAASACGAHLRATIGGMLRSLGCSWRRDRAGATTAAAASAMRARVILSIVGRLPSLLRQRREIRSKRVVDDAGIRDWMRRP